MSGSGRSRSFRKRERNQARAHAAARQDDAASQRRHEWERRQRRRYVAYGLMALGNCHRRLRAYLSSPVSFRCWTTRPCRTS